MSKPASCLKGVGLFSEKVAWFYVAGILIWYLLRYFSGDRLVFVRIGNFFLPWLFISLIPITGLAIFYRRVLYWGLCILLLLLLGHQMVKQVFAINFDSQQSIAISKYRSYKVFTFNINMANDNVDAIAELIKQAEPDLVALQEVNLFVLNRLDETLGDSYPFVHSQWRGKNFQVILSRYPAKNQFNFGRQNGQNTVNTFQVEVETPQGQVTVWNIHPPTPLERTSWTIQQQMLSSIANEVSMTKTPIILLGDFNTTPQTENYQLIADQLMDIHAVVGRGFGFTFPSRTAVPESWRYIAGWPTPGPVVRIDMIFVS